MAQRPLFDPSRIRPPAEPPRTLSTLSVRQVNELIRGAILKHVPSTLHVLGEIGDFSRPASGHLYFTLKDADAELRCVMWRSAAAALKFQPAVGMELIATGGIEVYSPRGSYQLIVRKLEPRGVGALELAFRQLRERLEREGLFDPRRKKPLPRLPQRVALVTSPSGAAIRDILQTLQRRFPGLDILLFPVRVQGEGAAGEIAAAVRDLNAWAAELGGIDVAIVGRGGGSLEDLWAFNEEVVARAIAASRIPIVSAVGHEVDVSISDLVADVRAATPSAAAELITPTRAELLDILGRQAQRAQRAATSLVAVRRAELEALLAYDGLSRPLGRLRERMQLLDEAQHRLRLALLRGAQRARQRLARREHALVRFGSGAQAARFLRALELRVARAGHAAERLLRARQRALAAAGLRAERAAPAAHIPLQTERVTQALRRVAAALLARVRHGGELLASRMRAIDACHPQRVLARGYSVTRDARTRRALRSAADVQPGQRLLTQLADGEVQSTADDPRQPRLFD